MIIVKIEVWNQDLLDAFNDDMVILVQIIYDSAGLGLLKRGFFCLANCFIMNSATGVGNMIRITLLM